MAMNWWAAVSVGACQNTVTETSADVQALPVQPAGCSATETVGVFWVVLTLGSPDAMTLLRHVVNGVPVPLSKLLFSVAGVRSLAHIWLITSLANIEANARDSADADCWIDVACSFTMAKMPSEKIKMAIKASMSMTPACLPSGFAGMA